MQPVAVPESRPHPWLTFVLAPLLSVATTLATLSFTAGGKSEQLAAEFRRNDAQDAAIAVLQSSRSDVLVTLGELKVEMRHQRAQLDNIQALLSGGVVRR